MIVENNRYRVSLKCIFIVMKHFLYSALTYGRVHFKIVFFSLNRKQTENDLLEKLKVVEFFDILINEA